MVTGGKGRPESEFDAEVVFAACAQFDVAVEVNSRPERLDPPKRLLRLAVEAGCRVAIDTDAHAPGQLDWQHLGCERAHLTGVTADRVVNAWGADELLAWTGRGALVGAGARCSGTSAPTGAVSSAVRSSGRASATSRAHAASRHSASTRSVSRSWCAVCGSSGSARPGPRCRCAARAPTPGAGWSGRPPEGRAAGVGAVGLGDERLVDQAVPQRLALRVVAAGREPGECAPAAP